MLNIKKNFKYIYECPKDCLNCANSFSEPSDNGNDILHCMVHDEEIVNKHHVVGISVVIFL